MEIKLEQISAVSCEGSMYVFALDREGNFWQWMNGKWKREKNPTSSDAEKKEPEPRIRNL